MNAFLSLLGAAFLVSVACAQTADQPTKPQTDQQIFQTIRNGLLADTSLSSGAKNCQIVVRRGAVTLRGTIATKEERNTIVQMALRSVEESKIVDALEVKRAGR